ncbi:hypothetical protein KC342_g101 [Hortaea werneckii]|nr:hypothetical protein KC342_g101 [Hortaea werneckii]
MRRTSYAASPRRRLWQNGNRTSSMHILSYTSRVAEGNAWRSWRPKPKDGKVPMPKWVASKSNTPPSSTRAEYGKAGRTQAALAMIKSNLAGGKELNIHPQLTNKIRCDPVKTTRTLHKRLQSPEMRQVRHKKQNPFLIF